MEFLVARDRYIDDFFQQCLDESLEQLVILGAAAAWGDASDAEVLGLAQRFLAQRSARRLNLGLSPALIAYEQQREWAEGLAHYVELDIWRQAYLDKDYQPLTEVLELADCNGYQGFPQRLA